MIDSYSWAKDLWDELDMQARLDFLHCAYGEKFNQDLRLFEFCALSSYLIRHIDAVLCKWEDK